MRDLEELLMDRGQKSNVVGEWFNIRWMPDVAAGEIINIGVGFSSSGRVYTKLLDYFERVKCLYGEAGAFHASFIIDVIVESTRKNQFEAPIPQVIYDHKGFAQGVSVDVVLKTLFDQTVTLAKKVTGPKKRTSYPTVSIDQLYVKLVDYLKPAAGLGFGNFVPEQPSLQVQDNTGFHELYIPFRDGEKLLGGLASAAYAEIRTIELNLLKAGRDVETAMKLGRGTKPAVFVLKPGEELGKAGTELASRVDEKLDKFDWYMSKQGIKVNSHVTVSGLGEEIYDWADVG
jgi:hypothetical protein